MNRKRTKGRPIQQVVLSKDLIAYGEGGRIIKIPKGTRRQIKHQPGCQ